VVIPVASNNNVMLEDLMVSNEGDKVGDECCPWVFSVASCCVKGKALLMPSGLSGFI